jgi:hypothetical protein
MRPLRFIEVQPEPEIYELVSWDLPGYKRVGIACRNVSHDAFRRDPDGPASGANRARA